MKRTKKYILLGLAFWVFLFLGWEWWNSFPKVRLTPISYPETKEAKIDSVLIQGLSHYLIPGMAVGIIENEKVTYLKAFGFENLQTKDSLTVQSLIPVASVSKIFTALTLANFALENELSIDTTINSILSSEKRMSAEFNDITLKNLLNHTSGLSDNRGISSLFINKDKRNLAHLPNQLKVPNLSKLDFQYADANFDLIGYLMEAIEGRPFEEIAKERTLQAGGMKKSHFVTEWPTDTLGITGHQRTFLWKRIEKKVLKLERFPSPSSGLILTPHDLSMALLHLSREDMGIFGDELAWLKNDTDFPVGFQSIDLNGSIFIGHFGDQGGYSSLVVYSSELELAFFLVANAEDHPDFRKAIAAEVLKIILN
ncbi:serine hydrolase domain-containing protein [Algoriphagus sp.]|uniref:serine hydrolase domain-containing protein n=1 Tax=Algoriphagus sp. TaxID=1872435 RepID=UPI003919A843